MSLRLLTLSAVAVASLAILLNRYRQSEPPPPSFTYVKGKDRTVLFIVSEHHGCSNVHLATAQSLLELHPDIQLHFASFPKLGPKFPRLAHLAKKRQEKAKEIVFHPLKSARSYTDACLGSTSERYDENGTLKMIVPPGLEGLKQLSQNMQNFLAPWTAEEHLALYQEIGKLIDGVDPAVVVLDPLQLPAIEATRDRNRLHAFVSPNALVDAFKDRQPYGKMFWKYPAMGSGLPFPVPWRLIPLNIYLNAVFIMSLFQMPELTEKRNRLLSQGISDPINLLGIHRPGVPWITQTTPGASIPLDFVPQNVTCTGPIVLSPASAEAEGPELVDWLKRKPTVLINFGTLFAYSIHSTQQVIGAIELVFEKDPNLQILWKYNLAEPLADQYDWKKAVKHLETTGRLKVFEWLDVDPPSLLHTGHIVATVTHGGSNGFHEALEAGVPQVVVPMWIDLYNFAQLSEQIGIGLWACRDISPSFNSAGLGEAILRVSDGRSESLAMRKKVKQLSDAAKEKPGREIAAEIVAQLARSGC